MTQTQPRDRVAIPFKHAMNSATMAILVLILAAMVAHGALILILGQRGSHGDGGPVIEFAGAIGYGAAAWYAWRQLSTALRPAPFRLPTRADLVIFVAGCVGVEAVNLLGDALITAVGQGGHVQFGFEHYTLAMGTRAGTAIAILVAATGAVVAGPACEELVIRGLFFGGIVARLGIMPAALASAVLFAALHGDPVYFSPILLHGIIFALAYAATGNLLVPITIHAANNALWLIPLAAKALNK